MAGKRGRNSTGLRSLFFYYQFRLGKIAPESDDNSIVPTDPFRMRACDMKNYRFAFFTVDWNCELVENTIRGLKKFAQDHENVQICIFDCFGQETESAKSRIEYRIFDLPDLTTFDGLLIQGNQIVLEKERQKIAQRIADAKIPAVSIDCPIDGCVTLGLDNRAAQHDITEHVIREHGARSLVYLTGLLHNGSPSGMLRREGFLDACRDYGLRSEDLEVIECTWRTADGKRVAEDWIKEGKKLPDAFICSNDEMAIGMIEIFTSAGIRVPEDVIITGFDNVSSAILSDPQVTTVDRDFDEASYTAMGVLYDLVNGKKTADLIPLKYSIVCSESCGCAKAVSDKDTVRRYSQRTHFLKRFHAKQARLVEQLLDVADLPRLMGLLEEHHEVFGCERICLCVNDYYFDNYDKEHFHHNTETFGEKMVAAYRDSASSTIFERYPTKQLLPKKMIETERFLVFYPMHYNTWSIGYLAMNDMSAGAQMNLHEILFNFVEIAVENVRKKGLLQHLNSMLDNLYVRDKMTGLFNRFGYERFAESTFDEFQALDGGAQIIFIDMDGLKTINDVYGHEMGDEAIRQSAQVLEDVCGPKDFLMRYGGDEFLVIASIQRTDFEQDLQKALQEKNAKRQREFDLSLSVGIIPAPEEEGRSLEAYIQDADALMYENKKQRRLARG